MNFNATLTNNSAKTLNLSLLDFFTEVTGPQIITLAPEAVHEFQADGSEVEANRKFWFYCQGQGIEWGKQGLLLALELAPPTIGE